ncbi:MAG: response regulator [Bifidobacteriaceae bacterium]|jgi:CheY-like chemotaxis protein|nr:response regulator [Bifidobacteriaceae bacterium]
MTVSAPTSEQGGQARQTTAVKILLYSDNADARNEVKSSLGGTLGAAGRPIEWTEVATHEIAMITCHEQTFDLVVMDNDASRLGGVGLTQQMRNELHWEPVILLLLARQQDAWLAAWSGADAALLRPVDPFKLAATVADLVGETQA